MRLHIGQDDLRVFFFTGFAAITLLSLLAALIADYWPLALLPAAPLLIYLLLVDPRLVFLILFACVPISTEVYLPNGFGTDLPTEPLMVILTGAGFLYFLRHGFSRPLVNWKHPISLLLFLHLGWIAVSALYAGNAFVSVKYLLAKTWYIVPFYLLAGVFLRRPADLRRLFWFIYFPLTASLLITLARHAPLGFSFAEVHRVLHPFYRNHVIYASILAIFFPFLCVMWRWQARGSFQRSLLFVSIPLYLVAIYLAYTRAAYVALAVAAGAQLIFSLRLTRQVIALLLVGALALLVYFSAANRYLDYAPNYEETVSHYDFNNLIEATYQFEDISTMERLYRWVAGAFMVAEKPWFGFGPGNFYPEYKSYTVTSFRTYVSNNPERSGIHNYYLMILVEQGFPGLFLFLALIIVALVTGERLYHQLDERRDRQMVLIALHFLVIILTLSLINDLIETDKVGPFFFISLAILVNLDEKNNRENLARQAKE